MTALRQRMEDDIVARGLADRTRESYLWAVTGLARFYRRPPDRITLRCKRISCICCASGSDRGVRATWSRTDCASSTTRPC
jgi:hypothetical protein